MTKVSAIYENGVLRPTERLPLKEGETVEVTVEPRSPAVAPLTLEEWERRLKSAKNIQDWLEVANACPEPDDGYDVIKELNEIRRANNERLLTREAEEDQP